MNSSRRNNIGQIIKRLNEIGLEIESVKDEEQDYLDNMSNNFVFHSVVVYTKRIEKCTYFFKNIKAKNVYINKSPFENIDIDFSEFEFLYQKKIVY